jgi:hypothetical protein
MASITITTTAPQDARIAPAIGSLLGLGRNATVPEVKAYIIDGIRQSVQDYERRVAQAAIIIDPLDPT